MISFAGMKAEESKGAFEMLPAGPYMGIIKAVKVDGLEPDQQLVLRLDVDAGEYKDYFYKRYKHDSERGGKYEARYKGDYKLRIPNPENPNAKYPESDLRRFNDALYRIEKSNPGFTFKGDENTLKGLKVGFNMQGDTYNGSEFTRIGRLEIYQDVKNGLVKAMEPRKRQEQVAPFNAPPVDQQTGFTAVEVEELPF